MLKAPAMIMLSIFDRSWFADWVVSSRNIFRLLLLGGLSVKKIPHFLFLIVISTQMFLYLEFHRQLPFSQLSR